MSALANAQLVNEQVTRPSFRAPVAGYYPALRLVEQPIDSRRAIFWHRRVLAFVFVGCALFGAKALGSAMLGTLVTGSVPRISEVPPPAEGSVLIVESGQTYWSIAESMRPSGDIRKTVDALVKSNGGRPLQVGDRLVIAVGNRKDK